MSSNIAIGAGRTVITICLVISLPHVSIKFQSTYNVPPHLVCDPLNSPGTDPSIKQGPVPLLENSKASAT